MGLSPSGCGLHLLQLRDELLPRCPAPSPPTESSAPLGTLDQMDCTTGLSCEAGIGPRHPGEGRVTRRRRSASPQPAAVREWGKC